MTLADKIVLVVEDNPNNYNLTMRLLATLGIEHIEWITSGWKVAEKADALETIDLVLLDIQLPYEDGFAVQKQLRRHPRLKDTRIVAVTANADETHMQRAINDGFNGFIGKPLDPDRFPEQITRVLAGEPVWEWH